MHPNCAFERNVMRGCECRAGALAVSPNAPHAGISIWPAVLSSEVCQGCSESRLGQALPLPSRQVTAAQATVMGTM